MFTPRVTDKHTLKRPGFHDIEIRKFSGVWESLSYRNSHTGDERWTKLEGFSEQEIQEHIEKYADDNSICDDCNFKNPSCNKCLGSD